MQHINKLYTANYSKRNSTIIDTIIIHYTEVNFTETLYLLQNHKRKVSAHYLICEEGNIYQLVSDQNKAWHAGDSYWNGRFDINQNSIGIELVNDGKSQYANKQINSLIELIKTLKKKYNIQPKNIIGHSDIAPLRKDDPGELFPWKLLAKNNLVYYPQDYSEFIANYNNKFSKQHIVNILSKIGYKINEEMTEYEIKKIIKKFCLRFLQDEISDIWNVYINSTATRIINDLKD